MQQNSYLLEEKPLKLLLKFSITCIALFGITFSILFLTIELKKIKSEEKKRNDTINLVKKSA